MQKNSDGAYLARVGKIFLTICIANDSFLMLSQDVCSSACLSVTRRYCAETAKHIKLFHSRVAKPF